MKCGDDDLSPPYVSTFHHGPYSSSIASSASSSSASVWSDADSQSSDDSSVHSGASDSELPESYSLHKNTSSSASAQTATWAQANAANVVPERRSHPRRTAGAPRTGPPSLVRQCDRKVSFVDGLVDTSAQIVEAIWPLSSVVCRAEMGAKGVLPLRTFIQETLRRSRTSYSTLQVALYYLILIKSHVPQRDFTMEQSEDDHSARALQCGRRMFLAALILASKYLQDRNYSASAWSKICGLSTMEINQNETAFLLAVNWKLHITEAVFQRWSDIMLKFTSNKPGGPSALLSSSDVTTWKAIVIRLTPQLDNMDAILASPSVQARLCRPTLCSVKSSGYSTGSKRSRPVSVDNILQENVRDVLNGTYASQMSQSGWSDNLLRQRKVNTTALSTENATGLVLAVSRGSDRRKRACCSVEFAKELREPTLLARSGIWAGILH